MSDDTETEGLPKGVVVQNRQTPPGAQIIDAANRMTSDEENPNVKFKPGVAGGAENVRTIDASLQAARGAAEKVREAQLLGQLDQITKASDPQAAARAERRLFKPGHPDVQKLIAAEKAGQKPRSKAMPTASASVTAEEIAEITRQKAEEAAARQAELQAQQQAEKAQIEKELAEAAEKQRAQQTAPVETSVSTTQAEAKRPGLLTRLGSFLGGRNATEPSPAEQQRAAERLSQVTGQAETAGAQTIREQKTGRIGERVAAAQVAKTRADIQKRIGRARDYDAAVSRTRVQSEPIPVEEQVALGKVYSVGQEDTRQRAIKAGRDEQFTTAEDLYKRRPDLLAKKQAEEELAARKAAEAEAAKAANEAKVQETIRQANIATGGTLGSLGLSDVKARGPLTAEQISKGMK